MRKVKVPVKMGKEIGYVSVLKWNVPPVTIPVVFNKKKDGGKTVARAS